MSDWSCNFWQKQQSEVGWARLRIAEQEGRIASWADGAEPATPVVDAAHLDELANRAKALYQECDELTHQRDKWQAECQRLENELVAHRQQADAQRAELHEQELLLERERAELQSQRQGLEIVVAQLRQEMSELRQSIALPRVAGEPVADIPQHEPPERSEQSTSADADDDDAAVLDHAPRAFREAPAGADAVRDQQPRRSETPEREIPITEHLMRFALEKRRRPFWVSSSALLVGAALAASCGIFVWASFDSIKIWLRF